MIRLTGKRRREQQRNTLVGGLYKMRDWTDYRLYPFLPQAAEADHSLLKVAEDESHTVSSAPDSRRQTIDCTAAQSSRIQNTDCIPAQSSRIQTTDCIPAPNSRRQITAYHSCSEQPKTNHRFFPASRSRRQIRLHLCSMQPKTDYIAAPNSR